MTTIRYRAALPALAALALFLCAGSRFALAQSTNGVLREVYLNIGGNAVSDLTSHPSFPSSPSLETLQPIFEAPNEFADNYGQRMRALLIPPQTGAYEFWVASDDGGALFLSTTADPAQRAQIATVNSWTSSREWTKETNQHSVPITLTQGQLYYIEALQKEGGGGDNLAVRWKLPDGTFEEPIPNHRLIPYGLGPPIISQQPANTNVVEGGTANFTVRLSRMLGATFLWYRNGVIIPDGTNATYTLSPVAVTDHTNRFRCAVTNAYGGTNTTEAILSVTADTVRPFITGAANLGDPQLVAITFSEPLELASATTATNYTINNGITVLGATLSDDLRTVVLATSLMSVGPNYIVTVNHVRDRANVPNTIQTNSTRTFSLAYSVLDVSRVTGATEPAGPSSRRSGLAITEIHYHPLDRADGRNLEFIEIFNSQPWPEDISGFRISGEVDYTFPSNTVLNALSYTVVAKAPADIQAVYGLATARGPFTGALDNGGGTVRLRNRQDAVLLEVNYSDEPPWPPSADGGGHSLVLARASLGERQPRAWAASDRINGSPGAADTTGANTYRTILLNEFLAHTDPPDLDYIELFNYGNGTINLAGCVLTDDPATNKFIIPTNTLIGPRGFVVFYATNLGFALDAGGETIYLKNTNNTKVLDAVKFRGQANGVATGRTPDGAPAFSELAAKTPGTNNARRLLRDVVLNEIYYNPLLGGGEDEFIELRNHGTNTVNLGKWRLDGGIEFTFPNNTMLAPGALLVVANDAARLRSNHAHLTPVSALGNYEGSLANGGERVFLTMPDEVVTTNILGVPVTNTIRIVVDEVNYGTGGRWGRWSDNGGSSLELIDPRSDHRLAPSWADSDESAKSAWTTVEWTGVLDHGQGAADQFHLFLLGEGECLVDDVEVIPQGGANVVSNPGFENGMAGWFAQGNQNTSFVEASGGVGNSRCLRVRATGRGDTGANRIRTALGTSFGAGSTATLRAKVRWLAGHPEILLRLKGQWLEATGTILTGRNLGTPALPNSRARSNAPPAIVDVLHNPLLPGASQSCEVSARVSDPDGLAVLVLKYRVDPQTTFTNLPMQNRGAGFYSATLPGFAANTLVAFYIEAQDNFSPRATARFPDDAPARECLVRYGDPAQGGSFGTYRLWWTQAAIDKWVAREKLSNDGLDGTFIYGSSRVVYNMGGEYAGSPYHAPGFNSPVGNYCDYVLTFPKDDLLLNDQDVNLFLSGNGCCEGTMLREQASYYTGHQLGLPYTHRRHVHVFANGARRAPMMMEDSQQPNGDMIEQWFPGDEDGNLHKIQLWFEFDDTASSFGAAGASLGNWTTTGGVKKLARYRFNWAARAFGDTGNDYTNLFNLHDTATTGASGDAYTTRIESVIDVDQWMRTFAAEHAFNNPDSWGYGGGQNMYTYKPERDTWKLLLWDVDFGWAYGSPTDGLFGMGDGQVQRMTDHPPFRRAYLRALKDIAFGPLDPVRASNFLNPRYNAFVAAGFAPEHPSVITNYMLQRRTYILSQLTNFAAPFSVAGTNTFSTNRNLISLSGTAPFEAATLKVNGIAYRPVWTSSSNWVLRVALDPGVNALVIEGFDNQGQPVAGASATVVVNYTGVAERPEDRLVINEIMYHPVVGNADFVELHNTSPSNAFDLSNWRLDGVDFDFPQGTIAEPNSYLVVVKDRFVFAATYGATIPVVGEFNGNLDNGGETLKLIERGVTPEQDRLIDQVTYDDDPPWPGAPDGGGPSLQLIDPAQDNNRAANWAAISALSSNPPQVLLRFTNVWRYMQTQNLDGINWTAPAYNDAPWPSGPALLAFETCGCLPEPIRTTLVVTNNRITFYFRTHFTVTGNVAGASLKLSTVLDDGAVFYLNGQELYRQGMPAGPVAYATFASPGVGDATLTGPFILPGSLLLPGDNVLAVEVHQSSAASSDVVFGLTLETTYDVVSQFTPGVANSTRSTLPPFPLVWLNEVLPTNFFLGTNGISDRFGERDPWVELYNGGTNAVPLNGWFLANNYTNLAQWAFPTGAVLNPGQFLVVWLDGETNETDATEWHASFRASSPTGAVALVQAGNPPRLIDHLNYNVAVMGRSHGSYPDGNASGRRMFSIVTPRGTNNPAAAPVTVFLNEWMADNDSTIFDPFDFDFEDWFEIYNPNNEPANLDGFYLTDTLTNTTLWQVPAGVTVPALGYLLVWADGEPGQNDPGVTDLHAGFSLDRDGESIGLFAPDGTLIDAVTFGVQATDRSQGRFPDGQSSIVTFSNATPRAANYLPTSNAAPVLALIGNRTADEGALLAFTCSATDADNPPQQLRYSLGPGTPAGAVIHATNGTFAWTPAEAQGPGVHPVTIVVTDNGVPPLSDSETVNVTVNEVNNPPTLAPITSRTVNEGQPLSVSVSATDPDAGPQTLRYSFDTAPPGMTIHSNTGAILWTPTEAQGPGNYAAVVRVTDDGEPPLSDTKTLSVTVNEVNVPPALALIPGATLHALGPFGFIAVPSDADLPPQTFTFSLDPGFPSGAMVDPASGAFQWTPQQWPATNVVSLRVTDSGTPNLSAVRSFTLVVSGPLRITNIVVTPLGQVTLMWPAIAGRSYQVQSKAKVDAPMWQNVGGSVFASGASATGGDTVGTNAHRVYRVQLVP
jgi:hypothetical protein